MRWTLGIDTSSTSIHLGLLQDGNPFLMSSRMVTNAHAEHITPLIRSFLEQAGITAQEISHVGAVTGPGSFTGLRIGLSFLKGLFITGETKILPLSSFEVVTQALSHSHGTIGVALDARQENIFWATYSKKSAQLTLIKEPQKISEEDFYTQEVINCDFVAYDTMGFTNSTIFESLATNPKAINLQETSLARGLAAAQLADNQIDAKELWHEAINIFPNYMQESYAERARKSSK